MKIQVCDNIRNKETPQKKKKKPKKKKAMLLKKRLFFKALLRQLVNSEVFSQVCSYCIVGEYRYLWISFPVTIRN